MSDVLLLKLSPLVAVLRGSQAERKRERRDRMESFVMPDTTGVFTVTPMEMNTRYRLI